MLGRDSARTTTARLRFVLTELDLGYTFANIAENSRNPEKFERNVQNAREAFREAQCFLYETFLSKSVLPYEEFKQLKLGMERLRTALRGLGERV